MVCNVCKNSGTEFYLQKEHSKNDCSAEDTIHAVQCNYNY